MCYLLARKYINKLVLTQEQPKAVYWHKIPVYMGRLNTGSQAIWYPVTTDFQRDVKRKLLFEFQHSHEQLHQAWL